MDGEAAVHMGGMTFWTFLFDAFVIFMFVLWIWLLIAVFSDLFRRSDISGGAKVIWVIFLIILPYLGVLAYLLTQGGGMAERNQAQAQKAREEIRQRDRLQRRRRAQEARRAQGQGVDHRRGIRQAPRQADLVGRDCRTRARRRQPSPKPLTLEGEGW